MTPIFLCVSPSVASGTPIPEFNPLFTDRFVHYVLIPSINHRISISVLTRYTQLPNIGRPVRGGNHYALSLRAIYTRSDEFATS